jgi:putative membrane protein
MKPQSSTMVRRLASPSAFLLAALLAGAAPTFAASPTTDATFLQQAVHTESTEAQIGQLAVTKSSNDGVQKLGQMLIDDHTTSGQEATRLANTLQVSLPMNNPPDDQEATYRSLSGLSGTAFDNAFINAVIKNTEASIADYEAQAQSGDGEVAAYADKTLPLLEKHLQMARMLKMRATEHNPP